MKIFESTQVTLKHVKASNFYLFYLKPSTLEKFVANSGYRLINLRRQRGGLELSRQNKLALTRLFL